MARNATYQRIADQIRDRITTGELAEGTKLPSESQLMEEFATSRNTVRNALGELESEGLISTAQGRGSFVREWNMLTFRATRAEHIDRPASWSHDSFVSETREAGHAPSTEFTMRIEPAVPEVADRLKIEGNSLVVFRRVVRYADSKPVSRQDSWYPMEVAETAGLNVPHDIPEGTVRAMAKAGLKEVGHYDELTARMPTPEESQTLDVPVGVPVIVYVRTAWTETEPIRVTRTTFPCDRNKIVYELGSLDKITNHDA
ncbi:GntR family transcriptional regulator [Myceligenerans cantabricum]